MRRLILVALGAVVALLARRLVMPRELPPASSDERDAWSGEPIAAPAPPRDAPAPAAEAERDDEAAPTVDAVSPLRDELRARLEAHGQVTATAEASAGDARDASSRGVSGLEMEQPVGAVAGDDGEDTVDIARESLPGEPSEPVPPGGDEIDAMRASVHERARALAEEARRRSVGDGAE